MTEVEPLVIESELTLADWAAWARAWSEGTRARVPLLALTAAAFLPVVAGLALLAIWRTGSAVPIGPFFVGGLVFAAGVLLVQRRYAAASVPLPHGWFLGSVRIEVLAEGLRVYRTNATTMTRWAALLDVTRAPGHVFVWVDSNAAFVLPVRDFPGGLEPDVLVAHLRAAAGLAPAPPGKAFEPPPDDAPRRADEVGLLGALARRLAWQTGGHAGEGSGDLVIALSALAAGGVWMGLDRWTAGSGATWTGWGLGALAWYGLGLLGVVWILHRVSFGRAPYRAILAVVMGAVPLAVAAGWAIDRWVPPQYQQSAWVMLGLVAVAHVARSLVSVTGFAQPRALLALVLAGALFGWGTAHVWIHPHFWYAAPDEEDEDVEDSGTERLVFEQSERVDAAAERVERGRPGRPDVFFVGFAGVAEQRVFAEELKLSARIVAERYDAQGRALLLVNDQRDRETFPFATVPALERALARTAARMSEEDVLFLMITSHGSSDPSVSVSNDDWPFADLDADALRQALDDSGIRRRVVVISACYSGAFVEPLANDDTIVITSAAADKTSFGCSDENDVTDFGRAFIQEALPGAASLADAFESARKTVEEKERLQGLPGSDPQIRVGSAMGSYWAGIEAQRWRR